MKVENLEKRNNDNIQKENRFGIEEEWEVWL